MKRLLTVGGAVLLYAGGAARADTVQVTGFGVSENGGQVSYLATITYDRGSDLTDGLGTLSINMENTSLMNSNITAFVFNIEGETSYEALTPNPTHTVAGGSGWWNLTSEDALAVSLNEEDASPYLYFEAGIGVGLAESDAAFKGGSNGTDIEGLGAGESWTFNWTISGLNADILSAASFASEQSVPGEKKNGGSTPAAFVVRFKGVADANGNGDAGSAKIVGGEPNPVVPLPAPALAGMILLGALGLKNRLRSRSSKN